MEWNKNEFKKELKDCNFEIIGDFEDKTVKDGLLNGDEDTKYALNMMVKDINCIDDYYIKAWDKIDKTLCYIIYDRELHGKDNHFWFTMFEYDDNEFYANIKR